MEIPSWLIDLAKSLGAGSAPILALICFLQWRENGKLRDRLFDRLDRADSLLEQMGSVLTAITGGMANNIQKSISAIRTGHRR